MFNFLTRASKIILIITFIFILVFVTVCCGKVTPKYSLVAGGDYSFQISIDQKGKTVVQGQPDQMYDFSDWEDVVSVSAGGGNAGAIKSDGSVVVTGNNEYGACNVSDWTDIVMLGFDGYITYGLKSNGTVLTTGHHYEEIPFKGNEKIKEVSTWKNIVHIDTYFLNQIGVKSNGKVHCISFFSPKIEEQVSKWRNIKTATTSAHFIVGVKNNGKIVVAVSEITKEFIPEKALERLDELEGAIKVHSSQAYIVGLMPDGTLRIVNLIETMKDESIEKLDGTTDVVDINSWRNEIFILLEDGTVLFGGES